MAKVAFLGLGVMGFPMAGHLVAKGGHEVTVFNRTPAKAKAWAEKFGGKTAATPKAAAEGQDFVMACVGNDNDLRAIALGADGAFFHAGERGVGPERDRTQVVVVADTGHDKVLAFRGRLWRCRGFASEFLCPGFGFGRRPVEHRYIVAAFDDQMSCHGGAHNAETEKSDFSHVCNPEVLPAR